MTRPSGLGADQEEEPVGSGGERGVPVHNSHTESSPSGLEREKDGALGVSGGQPDAPPSGPNTNNDTPEPKVKRII